MIYTVRKFEPRYSSKFNDTSGVCNNQTWPISKKIYNRFIEEVIKTNLCNQVPLTLKKSVDLINNLRGEIILVKYVFSCQALDPDPHRVEGVLHLWNLCEQMLFDKICPGTDLPEGYWMV